MSENEIIALPAWQAPETLDEARSVILRLGKSLHEHAYLICKALAWAKGKLNHGEFTPWLKINVWFSERTAQRFMTFASKCDDEEKLLEYQPGKNDIMSDLRSSELSADDAERAIRLAKAYELLEESENEPPDYLIEAREFAAEYDETRAGYMTELAELSTRLPSVTEIGELKGTIDRATHIEKWAFEMKTRALRGLGNILNSIPQSELNDFLAFVNLPEIHRKKLAAERIAELLQCEVEPAARSSEVDERQAGKSIKQGWSGRQLIPVKSRLEWLKSI